LKFSDSNNLKARRRPRPKAPEFYCNLQSLDILLNYIFLLKQKDYAELYHKKRLRI
jgi:hypothetical protein